MSALIDLELRGLAAAARMVEAAAVTHVRIVETPREQAQIDAYSDPTAPIVPLLSVHASDLDRIAINWLAARGAEVVWPEI